MANEIRTGDNRVFNKGRSSKFHEVPEFDKHLKKAGGYIGRNVVEITIKEMKIIVRKPLMIKIIKLRLRNLDNQYAIHIQSISQLIFNIFIPLRIPNTYSMHLFQSFLLVEAPMKLQHQTVTK